MTKDDLLKFLVWQDFTPTEKLNHQEIIDYFFNEFNLKETVK